MTTRIKVKNNGSIEISSENASDFVIIDSEEKAFDLAGRTKISLCRCGHSNKMPFCDGSHGKCDFKSEVKAYALQAPVAK